jgi:hypothetical protein
MDRLWPERRLLGTSSLVGIDGWSSQSAILQAGTKSVVTVSGGKVTQSTWAWYEWYPAFEIAYSNFQVQPGDTVEVVVCSFSPTTGYAGIVNVGANTSTSVSLSAPAPTAVLRGQNAERILENDSIGGAEAPFSDYGAIFFYDCNAGTSTGGLAKPYWIHVGRHDTGRDNVVDCHSD